MDHIMMMGEFSPEDGCLNEVLHYISLWQEMMRIQPACLSASVSVSPDRKTVYAMDVWTDESTMLAYFDWLADQGDLIKLNAYLSDEPVTRILSVVDPSFHEGGLPQRPARAVQ